MMPSSAIEITSQILIRFCFYTPLAFLVIYTIRTPWWRTVHGRTLASLAAVFVLVLFREMLFLWGVLSLKSLEDPDALAWISTCSLALAPMAFFTMTWQLIRKPLRAWWRWLRGRDGGGTADPLTRDAKPPRELKERS